MLTNAKRRLLSAALAMAVTAGFAIPAEARYYVVYWADYVGGTTAGVFEYEDGGALCSSSGTMDGIMSIYSEPGVHCD